MHEHASRKKSGSQQQAASPQRLRWLLSILDTSSVARGTSKAQQLQRPPNVHLALVIIEIWEKTFVTAH